MTPRRSLAVCLLLLLFAMLAGGVTAFAARQQAVALEGNHLYSPDAFTVNVNARLLLREARKEGIELRVFSALSEGGNVRAVASSTESRLGFPIHEGRSFEPGDTAVALVGSGIDVRKHEGRLLYDYEGRSYEVVGRLGLRSDSLVENDVLLLDESLFSAQSSESLVVDGSVAGRWLDEKFPSHGATTHLVGANGRTNVDFVSPLLVAFGYSLSAVGVVATGLVTAHADRPRRLLAHFLGSEAESIFGRAAGRYFLLLAAAAGAPMLVFRPSSDGTAEPLEHLSVACTGVIIGMLAFVAGILAPSITGRRSSWK
jgi:hypothetical protein